MVPPYLHGNEGRSEGDGPCEVTARYTRGTSTQQVEMSTRQEVMTINDLVYRPI